MDLSLLIIRIGSCFFSRGTLTSRSSKLTLYGVCMRTLDCKIFFLTLSLALGLPVVSAAEAPLHYRIIPLGPASGSTVGSTLNDNGSKATGHAKTADPSVFAPFIYTRNGANFQYLNIPGGPSYAFGNSINNSGKTLVSVSTSSFIYNPGRQTFTQLQNPFGDYFVRASSINNFGQTVGHVSSPTVPSGAAILWGKKGATTDLTSLYGIREAVEINDSQEITCSKLVGTMARPCVISNGALSIIGSDAPSGTYPFGGHSYGINNLGHVVGYLTTSVGTARAFLWKDQVTTDLPVMNGIYPHGGLAVSDCDQVVGYASVIGSTSSLRAFIYQDDTVIDLNTLIPQNSGWVFNVAKDISKGNGRILVNGTFNGQEASAILVPNQAGICS